MRTYPKSPFRSFHFKIFSCLEWKYFEIFLSNLRNMSLYILKEISLRGFLQCLK